MSSCSAAPIFPPILEIARDSIEWPAGRCRSRDSFSIENVFLFLQHSPAAAFNKRKMVCSSTSVHGQKGLRFLLFM